MKFCEYKWRGLFFLTLGIGMYLPVMSQQNYFLYLQTENKQPFYVKIENKPYSSTAAGYLIIPKLTAGTYAMKLGFPKNEWAEQDLQIIINKKDAGYIVKNFGEKGWGLFNWQTMDVVMTSQKVNEKAILVSNDESKEAITANDKVKKSTAEETLVKPKDTVALSNNENVGINVDTAFKPINIFAVSNNPEKNVEPEIKNNASATPAKKTNGIVKMLSVWSSEGTELQYIDYTGTKPDTIRLLIPKEKTPLIVPSPKNIESPQEKTAETKSQPINIAESGTTESKQEEQRDISQAVNPVKEVNKEIVTTKAVLPNSDCKAFATDEDFLKIRKKMAAEENDDNMIAVAKKVFKTKCFTTEQIKNLSVLFLSDQGRYNFFDAAYPFVYDAYNFKKLEQQLTDNYFINRFKSMLRQ